MPKVSVYNHNAEEAGTLELAPAVFGVTPKQEVVHQVYLALEANRREPWADTKDRSEVRGGGKKPWKQKGTGRARHGSTRSPIWSGGGITFGPLSFRNYKQKINKKMNKAAVRMCLASKVLENKFVVLEDFMENGKTKDMVALRAKLPGSGKSTLVLGVKADDAVGLQVRNIPRVDLQQAMDVNVADLLHHQYIITTKEGVRLLEKRLS